MDYTKKKIKKLKKNEVIDIGEHGGEIIMLKDDKTLEKEGVKEGLGNTKTKKKNERGNSEGKNMDRETEVEGEDVASSRKVVEKGDVTYSEDYVKVLKKKKNKEGKKERKGEEVEHLIVNKDIITNKAERKKKNKEDKKNGGSGHKLTEHSVEDVSRATDKIQNVEIVDRGQELDGGLVEKAERKKKKKDKKRTNIGYQIPEQSIEDVSLPSGHGMQNREIAETRNVSDDCLVEKVGKKKRKREKKKNEVEVNTGASQDVTDLPSNATHELENTSTKGFETDGARDKDVMNKSRKKQRTREKEKELNASGSNQVNADSAGNEKGNVQKRKKTNSAAKDDQDAKPVKQKKKVKFSDQVEVFPLSDNEEKLVRGEKLSEKLVRGKRFSPEEDEIVTKAVNDYIEAHCLGDEGLNMVLNCRSHPEVRNCWKEIASALPYRPRTSVYFRAQTLFRRSETSKWTKEEFKQIKEFQKKHGNQWKLLAEDLQKHRVHIKDTWRRIRLSNMKKGHWNQEEYQALFDLVNLDLKSKYKEEKKSKHGMLRDNICWSAISDKLTTRSHAICCQKWYNQLTSSLVAEGEWADADDYRLINALYELDASCIEDVDWDNLLEHRDGDVCRKRWNQMVLHIGSHKTQSFGEHVEVLAKRYCPDLIEVREEWDNKPYVD